LKKVQLVHECMRYAFIYPNSANLGDDIQTLAALQFMGEDVTFVPRDQLGLVTDPGKVLLNGWWSHDPASSFPPKIDALPISMHLCQKFRDEVKDLSWFATRKTYARDIDTANWLRSLGFDAEFIGCLSLTFPVANVERRTKLLFVDTRHAPSSRCSFMLTHLDPVNLELPYVIRHREARQLLDLYAQADLVITSRLHCALPCVAMGVPVVCITKEDDPRFTGMQRFITICADKNLVAAIDREKQTRDEREANARSCAETMRKVITAWLQEENAHA